MPKQINKTVLVDTQRLLYKDQTEKITYSRSPEKPMKGRLEKQEAIS